jgi:predicted O-methyltransferase YrrM
LYSSFQLAKKYFHYYLTASNGKGHGIHSPFVFDFIKFVLNDRKKYACYEAIELIRKQLLQDHSTIDVEDFGAGSAVIKTNKRIISKIAASSLKPKKFSQLLFRIVQYYQPKTILELGTSFGITTAYLANGSKDATVYTLEGAASIAAIAAMNFKKLDLKNIQLKQGDFKNSFPELLADIKKADLAFVDGNHRKAPTLEYFAALLRVSDPSTIIIMDDIHWSKEMEDAWAAIQQHDTVTLTIDLFFIGLVFINPDFKVKQHFKIRF